MKISFMVTCSLLLACIPLVGCSETFYEQQMAIAKREKEKHSEIKTFDGEEEPPFPDLKENRRMINGIDVNKNGIRDDVEIWINRTYKDRVLREQARKFLKAYSIMVRISKDGDVFELMDSSKQSKDRVDLELAHKNYKQTIACLTFLKYPSQTIEDHILKNAEMLFNTKERKEVEMKVGQIISGIRFPIDPKKEDCSI